MAKAPSLFRRLLGSVMQPADRTRADRHARRAVELCETLLSERGEVSGAALARDALATYHALDDAARIAFFDQIARRFSPDSAELKNSCEAWLAEPGAAQLLRLQLAAEPPRQALFRRLNMAPGGTAALVDMRRQIVSALASRPEWIVIDADLVHLFSSWFNRGFLTLERIDWHTPAIILEKLIKYEAVHEIASWKDLQRRLEADRRCFAFFHPALPDEPLIFIEIALVKGMSNAVQPLIETAAPVTDPATADTAVFYSITNCQRGLRGISFGNLLIKQVAQRLGQEFPRIKTFATLSPIPGFSAWLASVKEQLAAVPGGAATLSAAGILESHDWHARAADAERAQQVLMPLCAYYLLHARHDNEPADSVARFHLGNGARLERLNWLADTSKRGLQISAGMMVNYLYELDRVESNHEVYVKEHEVVSSNRLARLAQECPLHPRARRK